MQPTDVESAPLNVLSSAPEVRSLILEGRPFMDRERRLPPELLEALRAAGAFRLSTPRELGGFELPLSSALRVLEDFARLDAVVAWNVWNGNLGFSAALLPQDGVAAIWNGDKDPIFANSVRPAGVARRVSAGYELSGRWDIVSGVDHADWIAVFAVVLGDASAEKTLEATPDVRVFHLRREQIQVLDTWNVNAMRGTGSKSVVAQSAVVRPELVISPLTRPHIDRPLYRIPAFTLAFAGGGAIAIGIAQSALDAAIELALTKPQDKTQREGGFLADKSRVQFDLGRTQAAVHAARAFLLQATDSIDRAAQQGREVDERSRGILRAAMSHAAHTAREALRVTYELASSSALYAGQALERIFRDGNAALQHAILQDVHFEAYGRILLGRPAGVSVL